MGFEMADPIIDRWGLENAVPWCRAYRDEAVRSADITLRGGAVAQLWLEPLAGGNFAACAWDRQSRRHREVVKPSELYQALTRGLTAIRSW